MVYFPQYRFELFRKTSDGTLSPSAEVLTGFTSLDYAGGIETTKDVLNLKFSNYRLNNGSWSHTLGDSTRSNNFLGIDDEIKFYAYYGSSLPSNPDDALIIAARVAGFDYKPESEGFTYTIKTVNRTEELLNTMSPYSSRANSGSANTCPTAINQMIARLSQFNPNKKLYGFYSNQYNEITGSFGNIARWRKKYEGVNETASSNEIIDPSKDFSNNPNLIGSGSVVNYANGSLARVVGSLNGSTLILNTGIFNSSGARYEIGYDFPTIDYNETWKPTYYNIEKLSTVDYTQDDEAGEYIFYVKYTPFLLGKQDEYGPVINEFVWKQKPLINSGNLVDGSHITNVNINLDLREVQNLLIVNAGTDRKGNGITTVAYNTESMGKYGVKSGYYTRSRRVFSELHTQEIKYVESLGKVIDSDGMPASGTGSYPITMNFTLRNEDGLVVGSALVANNKNDWNQYLRDEAKWQAKLQAIQTLEKLGEPRYALSAEMIVGSNTLIAGDLYTFIVPSYGWMGTEENPGYKLRIKDLQHSFTDLGWTTRIEAMEDEKVISDYLGNRRSSVDNG